MWIKKVAHCVAQRELKSAVTSGREGTSAISPESPRPSLVSSRQAQDCWLLSQNEAHRDPCARALPDVSPHPSPPHPATSSSLPGLLKSLGGQATAWNSLFSWGRGRLPLLLGNGDASVFSWKVQAVLTLLVSFQVTSSKKPSSSPSPSV